MEEVWNIPEQAGKGVGVGETNPYSSFSGYKGNPMLGWILILFNHLGKAEVILHKQRGARMRQAACLRLSVTKALFSMFKLGRRCVLI